MREDEASNKCPATLGEYRDLCKAMFGPMATKPVEFLEKKIAESPDGENEIVEADDSQMRFLLISMMQGPND